MHFIDSRIRQGFVSKNRYFKGSQGRQNKLLSLRILSCEIRQETIKVVTFHCSAQCTANIFLPTIITGISFESPCKLPVILIGISLFPHCNSEQGSTGFCREILVIKKDPCNENRVPCNENRFFPMEIDLQGVLCKPYREFPVSFTGFGFAVYMG